MNTDAQNKPKVKNASRIHIGDEHVCVLGLGYVGLTLAVTFAELQVQTVGVDKNPQVLESLKKGKSHFYEKGLDGVLKKYLGDTLTVVPSIPENEEFNVFIISAGTPIKADGTPNLSFVENCAAEIAKHLKPESLVILRSTVPVGTTRNVVLPVLEKVSGLKAGQDFSLVFAPERTVEGNALRELRELPQIIGGIDEKSFIKASNLFRKTTPTVIKVSTLEAAEMVKIMDNTYRDLNFAIANELSLICEKLQLNAVEVIKAANMGYNRTNIPLPSPGVGGACLSKDPYILLDVSRKAGYEAKFVEIGRKINEFMPVNAAERVKIFLKRHSKPANPKIFIMGFAFKAKPMTSDIRNSPTETLVKKLKEISSELYGFDPAVQPSEIQSAFGVKPCSVEDGFKNADCIVTMLNHEMYAELDIFSLLNTAKKPVLFYDGWQQFKPADIRQIPGVIHEGTGFLA